MSSPKCRAGWLGEMKTGTGVQQKYRIRLIAAMKADNPRTWGTRSAAELRASYLVNGEGGGIGIELGDLGDGISLGGIDLDTCRREDGTFETWAREIIDRFASYTE